MAFFRFQVAGSGPRDVFNLHVVFASNRGDFAERIRFGTFDIIDAKAVHLL